MSRKQVFKTSQNGGDLLAHEIENILRRTSRRLSRLLEKGAEEIKDKAVDFAPKDTGALEDSISLKKNSRAGVNGRNTFSVFVDGEAESSDGRKVGEYAHHAHYSNEARGAGTVAKGEQAGPMFMERALDDVKPRLEKRAKDIVKEELR